MKARPRWTSGNRVRLLENGETFFPAVFDAIRTAQREVILETFILFEDKVGLELHEALLSAAQRGVQVDVLVDGFGSDELTPEFVQPLTAAGVRLRSFDPSSRVLGTRVNVLRRMHRKIVVVDERVAFVGGINYSADHLGDYGPQAKQDYAVEITGPAVAEIHEFAAGAIGRKPTRTPRAAGWKTWRGWGRQGDAAQHAAPPSVDTLARPVGAAGIPQGIGPGAWHDSVQVLFVTRDNVHHTNDIERHYRAAIRSARKRVLIANAYFFPGYRLLREMRRAARRGVDVQLVLQGEPDMPIVKAAASLLYEHLQRAGVQIHEYCERPLHGKVAVVDDDWATVGSSNLDPLSLSLNLEANVVLRDAGFAAELAGRLAHLIAHDCRPPVREPAPVGRWWWPSRWFPRVWPQLRSAVVFHFLRHYPRWAQWLPTHMPRLEFPHAQAGASASARTKARPDVTTRADEWPRSTSSRTTHTTHATDTTDTAADHGG